MVIPIIGERPVTSCHILFAVSACSRATPLEIRDRRRPATVILKGLPPICSICPRVSPL
ncbi:hypothetical protein D1872_275820 [compost metagenome]